MITRLSGRGIHKVSPLLVETSDLENVDDVVNIALVKTKGEHCTREVGVALVVVLTTAQHGVDVGIASRAQEVMHPTAMLIFTVPVEAVSDDGCQRTHVRQVRPQTVVSGNV